MGELKELIKLFGEEWDVIRQAGVTFSLALLLICGAITVLFRMAYKLRIANLESSKLLLQEQVADLRGRIETRDETIESLRSQTNTPATTSSKVGPLTVDTLPISKEPRSAAIEATLRDFVTGKLWLFHFNVRMKRSKTLSFLPNGSIGEGRNENEFRWEVEGDRLVIIRENGDVQNVFRRDPSGRLLFVEDIRAKGFKDQFMEPLQSFRQNTAAQRS